MLAGGKKSHAFHIDRQSESSLFFFPVWMPESQASDADVLLELIILPVTK